MINSLIRWMTIAFSFLFPLFFLQITADSYEYNKMILLIVTTLILLLLISVKVVQEKKLTFVGSSYGAPLFLLTLLTVVSSLLQSPNLTITLTTPLAVTTAVSGFLLYLLLIHSIDETDKEKILNILIIDAVLISFYVLFLYTGILPAGIFTPAGSLLATAMFLAVIAIYLTATLLSKLLFTVDKKYFMGGSGNGLLILYSLSLIIILGSIVLLTVHLFTDQTPFLLPFSIGWEIFLEVLKSVRTLVLGIGPTNFLTAFTLGKPISFNSTPYWNVIFTSSSSYLFTLGSETGIIAVVIYFFILIRSVKSLLRTYKDTEHSPSPLIKYNPQTTYLLALIAGLIAQILLPGNMVIYITTIVLMAFSTPRATLFESDLRSIGYTSYLILLPSLILISLVFYFGGRYYLAETIFKQSLDALLNNQGTQAYTLQNEAININPYLDRYRLAFSQTNLALANTLAAQKDLTDEDKQKIPKLVQQAIDQARLAVILYRTNIVNWDNLAKTYASLVNFAHGSEDWAIQSYKQRLLLDPLNPSSQISFGGLYLTLKNYTEAENRFRQAVKLKPDYANAHYNLSAALREQKKFAESYLELQTAYALLTPDSVDAQRVEKELADLKKLLPEDEQATPASILKPNITGPQTLDQVGPEKMIFPSLPTMIPSISLPQPLVTP